MKLRSLVIGLTLFTSGTVIGVATTQFASADVASGDRPVLVPIEPCRLVDTRPGDATVGPRSSKLGAADTLTVDAQEADTPCSGKIPADARSLLLNVTAIAASEQSFLTIWAGGDRPGASSLNPAPGEPPTPNAVTVQLSADQEFEVYNDRGSLNLLIDVAGYYVNHNHDDRYYTKAEVDAAVAAVQTSPTTLSSASFTELGAGWSRQEGYLERSNGGSASCIGAHLPVPAGARVEAVTVRYQSFVSGTVQVEVLGVRADTFFGDQPFLENLAIEQAAGDFSLVNTRAANSGSDPFDPAAIYMLRLCTDRSVILVGATVEFS